MIFPIDDTYLWMLKQNIELCRAIKYQNIGDDDNFYDIALWGLYKNVIFIATEYTLSYRYHYKMPITDNIHI